MIPVSVNKSPLKFKAVLMFCRALIPIYPIPNFIGSGISSHPSILMSRLCIFYLQEKDIRGGLLCP